MIVTRKIQGGEGEKKKNFKKLNFERRGCEESECQIGASNLGVVARHGKRLAREGNG